MITFAHPVRRYMRPEAPAIRKDASLTAAEREMRARGVDELALVDDHGHLVGCVHSQRLTDALAPPSITPELAELAEPSTLQISPDLPLSEVARRMGLLGTSHAYVVCSGRLMGWLRADDLLEATREHAVSAPVGTLSARPVVCVSADSPLAPALRQAERAGADLVMTEHGLPVGVLLRHGVGQLGPTPSGMSGRDAMRQPVLVLPSATPAHEAASRCLSAPVCAIVAVDDAGIPVGVVSDVDFAALIAESTAARGGPGSAPTPSRSRDVHPD